MRALAEQNQECIVTPSHRHLGEHCWNEEIPITLDGSDFRKNETERSVFLDTLCRWGKARELRLRNLHLSHPEQEAIGRVLRLNRNLKRLSFTNVVVADEGTFFETPQGILENRLQDVRLERCHVRGQESLAFIHRILEGAPIRRLTLRNMELDGFLSEISDCFSLSLVDLDIRDCRIQAESLKHLFKTLSKNEHVQSLTLSGCRLGYAVCQDLDHLLSRNTCLQTLNLSCNDIDGGMISYLAHGSLKINKSLETLVLSGNPIGNDGVEALVTLLTTNPTIRSLSLLDCEIWGTGCHTLAQGLASMRGLRTLYIDDDMEDFGDEILTSLQEHNNSTLRHLWTGNYSYLVDHFQCWKFVDYYLRLNRSKRQALADVDLPISLFPRILEDVSNNPALLYYFLRHKPDLAYR